MKTLAESLFDRDLVKKDTNVNDISIAFDVVFNLLKSELKNIHSSTYEKIYHEKFNIWATGEWWLMGPESVDNNRGETIYLQYNHPTDDPNFHYHIRLLIKINKSFEWVYLSEIGLEIFEDELSELPSR